MAALLWCEARCNGLHDAEPLGCQETAEGAFGTIAARQSARAWGWRVINGEWYCPACIKRRAAEATS